MTQTTHSQAFRDKLWQGRLHGNPAAITEAVNNSIGFDQRLVWVDIAGSKAHAAMLGKQGIIPASQAQQLLEGLEAIEADLKSGKLAIDLTTEDIHTFVEAELTQRLGDVGKKLHTGRSRNDQVATDLRLYTRDALDTMQTDLKVLIEALQGQSNKHQTTLMPGYTHLQPAQPVTFGLHLDAYVQMLTRDLSRLQNCCERLNECPLGAGALAGSSFPLDRNATAQALGFTRPMPNPMDAVASRDYVIETLSTLAILMNHLSRLCEEIILWNSPAFGFISLNDAYTTGSSMMPQKKNPDVAELVRGKTGRVTGSLVSLLMTMKALPLTYNKDMQEDKEPLFDALDNVSLCVQALTGTIATLQANPQAIRQAAETGFMNATDVADYLVGKGVPFRDAYKVVGQAVQQCVDAGCTLTELPLSQYQTLNAEFLDDLFGFIALEACLERRLRNL